MSPWLTWVVSIFGALGGLAGIAGPFLIPAQKRKLKADGGKTEADAAEVLSRAAVAILEPAQKEMDRLTRQVEKLTADLQTAQTEVTELRGQVDRLSKDLTAALDDNQRLRAAHEGN